MFLHQQLSRLVMAVVAVAFVYLLLTRRRSLIRPRYPSVLLLLLFLAAALVSWLSARAPGATSSVVDIILYPAAGLLFANLVLSESDQRRAWNAFLVSGLGVALLGLALYLAHVRIWAPNPAVSNRLNITFADPNITARFLTIAACAAVLMFAARKTCWWLCVATAVSCGVVLPMTFSRSGLALFILAIAVAVVFASDHRRAARLGATALLAFALSVGVNPVKRQRAIDATATVVTLVAGTAHNVTSKTTAPWFPDRGAGRQPPIPRGGRVENVHRPSGRRCGIRWLSAQPAHQLSTLPSDGLYGQRLAHHVGHGFGRTGNRRNPLVSRIPVSTRS